MNVTCAFCHTEVPKDTTWQSKVDPNNHYCNDDHACSKRWGKSVGPGIGNKGTT